MEALSSHFRPSGGSHWLSSIALILGFFVFYVIITAIYRLTFHPLAKYPGPLLSRISGWPTYLEAKRGNRHIETWKQHEIYGPIVRIAPNTVSINTTAALKGIYATRQCNVQKSDWYATIAAIAGDFSTHSMIDRQRHAFRRRVLDHAFTEPALASAEHFIRGNVKTWSDHLKDGASKLGDWSSAKNMSDWSTYLGYDIMGNLVFGKEFNCMENDEHRYVPRLMLNITHFSYHMGYIPFIRLLRPILRSPAMALLANAETMKFLKYASTQLESRMVDEKEHPESTRKDFYHYLLNAKDSETGQGFNFSELNAESSLLISAGADTSSLTLASVFFYLLHNPETLTKLTAEIRSSFSSPDQMNSKSLSNLPYLRACIDEALRLSPPAPGHLPREVLPGGLKIEEHYFPAGTVVGTSAYAIHHNKEYYPDPHAYRPERWIVDPNATNDENISSAARVSRARAAFCAFSLGPRGCVGKRLAYNELSIAIGMVLFSQDIRHAPGAETVGGGNPDAEHWGRRNVDEFQLEDCFLCDRNGPNVQFKPRE